MGHGPAVGEFHQSWPVFVLSYFKISSVQCFLPLALSGIMILVYCAELHEATSYETMIEGIFGPIAKGIVELCVAVYCFGSCLTYLVVIEDQIADGEFQ